MTDNKPEGSVAPENPTVESLISKVEGLEKALSDQNEASKRISESKTKLENDAVGHAAKIKMLEDGPKDLEAQVADLRVSLARSNAVSDHGIDRAVAGKLTGSPDEIDSLAKTIAETYKKILGDDPDAAPEKDTDGKVIPSGDKKPDELLKPKDDNPPTYSGTSSSTDIDALMKDVEDSLKLG